MTPHGTADSAPRGREAVMAAVLDAAVELLAEAGPRALSVRQVAERAGVNHALVHRHFGTKEEIVRRALLAQSSTIAEELRAASAQDGELTVAQALQTLADHPVYWTTLARVVLDEPDLAGQGTSPTTELFGAAMRAQGGDAGTTAAAACLMLGWRVFSDFVVEATGTSQEELDQRVSNLLRTLLQG